MITNEPTDDNDKNKTDNPKYGWGGDRVATIRSQIKGCESEAQEEDCQ